jgi:hypothetical protein
MDTTTTRFVACPQCGASATVRLGWEPETAWVAQVLAYRCPNECRAEPATVLRALGLDARATKRRRR